MFKSENLPLRPFVVSRTDMQNALTSTLSNFKAISTLKRINKVRKYFQDPNVSFSIWKFALFLLF